MDIVEVNSVIADNRFSLRLLAIFIAYWNGKQEAKESVRGLELFNNPAQLI